MSRRTALRDRDHDLAGQTDVGAHHVSLVRPGSARSLESHVLGLQRSHGNRAVGTLIVQRAPRDRPASTDAPWVKKGKKPGKKPPEAVDYAPTERNPKFADWSDSSLTERARQESDSNVKNSLYFAAELYEEYWFRRKDRGGAMLLSRVYAKLGDSKRQEFWMGVAQGTIKPGQKSADDDLSDKQF